MDKVVLNMNAPWYPVKEAGGARVYSHNELSLKIVSF